jgi:chromosome segregation ATPase
VGQAELEVQLQVWKDLAISKQVMMGAATDALGLDPECSTDELKAALEKAVKQAMEANAKIEQAQERAALAVADTEKRMSKNQKEVFAAEAEKKDALSSLKATKKQMVTERTASAKELKSVKKQLAEKQKTLKAINIALADTPENVLKKLRLLKKQKNEESAARQRADTEVRSLRKKVKQLEKRMAEAQTSLGQSAKLVENYRSLHKLCETLHEQLTPMVEDAQDLAAIPELDEQLLEGIEQAAGKEEK